MVGLRRSKREREREKMEEEKGHIEGFARCSFVAC